LASYLDQAEHNRISNQRLTTGYQIRGLSDGENIAKPLFTLIGQ